MRSDAGIDWSIGTDPNVADAETEPNEPTIGERPNAISEVVKASGTPIRFGFPAGTTFDVEYSADMQTWDVIASDASGAFEDADPGRNGETSGYYRGVAK